MKCVSSLAIWRRPSRLCTRIPNSNYIVVSLYIHIWAPYRRLSKSHVPPPVDCSLQALVWPDNKESPCYILTASYHTHASQMTNYHIAPVQSFMSISSRLEKYGRTLLLIINRASAVCWCVVSVAWWLLNHDFYCHGISARGYCTK